MPADLTSFVGRRHDLAAVRQLFSATRLVTLTGMGGVGKTRLALQAGTTMRRAFPDGVYLVELASLTDPDLLPQTVRDAIGLREQPAVDPLGALEDFLGERRLLLVLDNCEHLVDATADLVDRVLRTAPDVKVLVTSRQALRTVGEHIYPVAPLRTPDPDAVESGTATRYPAVALFADRAAAVLPGFTITAQNEAAVVRLCRRLEGIPLAIELACVRLRALTVDELASRLDDRFELLREGSRNLPERHQTLRALIDWSYDLCTPIEQLLWARSSVFAGGFTTDTLEAVCTDERLPASALLDTVARLVDKSILIRGEHAGHTRFRMLETLREYGRARLVKSPEAADTARRHRDRYAELIRTAGREWAGPQQEEWATRLQIEHADIRQALEYCMSVPGEAGTGLEMAAVPWFWGAMDHLTEARLWLDRGLALHQEPTIERAWALATTAYIAGFQGDYDALTALSDQAHELAVGLDDRTRAFADHVRGFARSLGGSADLASAVPLFTEALARYAASGLEAQYADSLMVELGASLLMLGEYDHARSVADELRARCAARGERWNLSYAHWLRGILELIEGDPERAEHELFEALRIKRVFRDTLGLGLTLESVAWTAAVRGEAERSALLFGATDQIWRTLGARQMRGFRRRYEAMARNRVGDARFEVARERGSRLGVDEVLAVALRESAADEAPRPSAPASRLTPREQQVADLVAEGMSNKEIAAKLVISLRTAEGHVERILSKQGFKSRAQIAIWVTQQTGQG
ncbi:LuxR C-terminal-related transcriptional regulator [Streptomyces lydicus]|uniref:LuxR C-terminal-related transcriptional regulator n=1 Tax=Streptomyces lydicus TaxID=47763 RepID=UPI0037A6EF4B